MNAFTVMEMRGAIIGVDSVGRSAPRSAEYDEGRGPRGDRAGAPRDLARSRRVGLSRIVCDECGGVQEETVLRHKSDCRAPAGGPRRRETTGPLDSASPTMRLLNDTLFLSPAKATAEEAGWHS